MTDCRVTTDGSFRTLIAKFLVACWSSSQPFPYRKSSELILTDLRVGLRPHHTPHTPEKQGYNPSSYILYLLAVRPISTGKRRKLSFN
ncbi:hypothetical protein E2C01_000847 [Portunus trituberculatus]|uniref:Uncharacterized protein n=1 Tax=Portunus trituberculatus TaxID=210409 RepID=A0A5B7CG45_PORTR|nr:hypothetical protein [Portunus trituberculatus]